MATITFHELVPVPWFRQRRLMKATLLEMFSKEKVPVGAIDFVLCNDEYLLQINQQFLQHDDLTDIITFDLTEPPGGSSILAPSLINGAPGVRARKGKAADSVPKLGEIYISVERVLENASLLGASREEELRRVMFHGCLHLCGYKDKLNEQKAIMRKMEDKYLRLYNLRST
jgi:probable rRNA maturation factor